MYLAGELNKHHLPKTLGSVSRYDLNNEQNMQV